MPLRPGPAGPESPSTGPAPLLRPFVGAEPRRGIITFVRHTARDSLYRARPLFARRAARPLRGLRARPASPPQPRAAPWVPCAFRCGSECGGPSRPPGRPPRTRLSQLARPSGSCDGGVAGAADTGEWTGIQELLLPCKGGGGSRRVGEPRQPPRSSPQVCFWACGAGLLPKSSAFPKRVWFLTCRIRC